MKIRKKFTDVSKLYIEMLKIICKSHSNKLRTVDSLHKFIMMYAFAIYLSTYIVVNFSVSYYGLPKIT